MQRRHHSARSDDGQALVEFALVLPLLLVLLFGVLEFGRLLNYWLDQNHLANQGARFAAVNRNPASSGTLAAYLANQGTTGELRSGSSSVDRLKVCVSYPNGTSNVGDPVRVRATTTFHLLPLLDLATLTVPIAGQADMRIEVKPDAALAGCSS